MCSIYVGPRIPDMYPLHIRVLDMRDATLPLRTVTATTLLCFWQGRNKILKHTPQTIAYLIMRENQ